MQEYTEFCGEKFLTKRKASCYNIITKNLYGSAMVSTGDLKYDKRSAPDNRVKMSKLKIKRQH